MRIRTIAIALVALAFTLPARAGNYTDWWWGGAAQDGQGVNVGQQANTVFVSWFTYDLQGDGMWVVFSGPLDSTGRVTGTFFRTTGPALGTPFDKTKVLPTPVGTGTLTFTDMHHATFEWSVEGKSGTLPLGATDVWKLADRRQLRRHERRQPVLYGDGRGVRVSVGSDGHADARARNAVDHRLRDSGERGLPCRCYDLHLDRHRRAERPDGTRAGHDHVPVAARHRIARSHAVRARPGTRRLAEGDLDGRGLHADRPVRDGPSAVNARTCTYFESRNRTMWFLSKYRPSTRIARGSIPKERKPSLS